MDRETALQAWKQMRSEIDSDNWLFVGTINPEMVDRAIEALETVIKEETNLPEIPDSWILCSKKMPESADCPMDCLVTRKSKTIGNYTDMAVAEKSGTWTHEDWEAIVLGDNVSGKKTGLLNTRGDEIVAWMPLPEPYKEGEQRETD